MSAGGQPIRGDKLSCYTIDSIVLYYLWLHRPQIARELGPGGPIYRGGGGLHRYDTGILFTTKIVPGGTIMIAKIVPPGTIFARYI